MLAPVPAVDGDELNQQGLDMDRIDPIHTLRSQIRLAKKQFRHNDDNSGSMFHPAKGFIDAYDVAEVESALEQYEMAVGTAFVPTVSVEETIPS